MNKAVTPPMNGRAGSKRFAAAPVPNAATSSPLHSGQEMAKAERKPPA